MVALLLKGEVFPVPDGAVVVSMPFPEVPVVAVPVMGDVYFLPVFGGKAFLLKSGMGQGGGIVGYGFPPGVEGNIGTDFWVCWLARGDA